MSPSTYEDYRLAEKRKFSDLSPFKNVILNCEVLKKSCHFKASTGSLLRFMFQNIVYLVSVPCAIEKNVCSALVGFTVL